MTIKYTLALSYCIAWFVELPKKGGGGKKETKKGVGQRKRERERQMGGEEKECLSMLRTHVNTYTVPQKRKLYFIFFIPIYLSPR